ncbi:hypothetical protein IWQ62_004624 [Dispira parvispora]|uniref:25S rRNA (uridine-N(3))-methyltransferase BMT5-like domain-containing protein n=1 Tax=Dispira parvispora TaxID=1520584 RepID=A0A9W8AL94_9FUNG|nr:hypothetical protein IWQ62_004624 [Dispira parvispora]
MAKGKGKGLKNSLNTLLQVKQKADIEKEKRAKLSKKTKTTQGSENSKVTRPKILPPFPFTLNDRILCVGEGNFSFSHALVKVLQTGYHLVATCYDSEQVVTEKYPDASDHINQIRQRDGTVLYNIDGTRLDKTRALKHRRFTHIIFNFPHVGMGIKDQDRNVRRNQELLLGFFQSALPLLTDPEFYSDDNQPGEIHVVTKTHRPYHLWQVRQLAQASGKLVCQSTTRFYPELFPGYEHRRTLGFQEGLSVGDNEEIMKSPPKLYVFVKGNAGEVAANQAAKKRKRKPTKSSSDSSDSDD